MRLFIGTYTRTAPGGAHRPQAIFTFDLHPQTGRLAPVSIAGGVHNPSYLGIHPTRKFLYSVSETGDTPEERSGGAAAFRIQLDGSLALLNQQVTHGAAPCYVSTDRAGRWLFAANYHSATLTVFPIQADGSLAPACQVIQHEGHSVFSPNQDRAHAHCILPDPANRFVLAADLGMDQVRIYRLDQTSGLLAFHGAAAARPGAGPRHIIFHPNQRWVYVSNELDSTVTAFAWDAQAGSLAEIGTLPTLPLFAADSPAPANAVADLHLTPDGRFLYVSNRGHNSLARYAVDSATGALAALGHTPSGGNGPRGFAISPDGRWLLCAHQHSNDVFVFEIDPHSGDLRPTGEKVNVPAGVCVKFLQ